MSDNNTYVVGFLFNDKDQVLLIEKQKPISQKGLLNGIGGKVENNESSYQCLIREFLEETGIDASSLKWNLFAVLHGYKNRYKILFFRAYTNEIIPFYQKTDEIPKLIKIKDINNFNNVLYDLKWLIPMALDTKSLIVTLAEQNNNDNQDRYE